MSGYASFADFYLGSEYAAFDQEHRRGGTFGLTMIEVDQGAIETVDPAVDETIIVSTGGRATFEYDFGDGWTAARTTPDTVDVQPAFQDCGFRLPPMSLRLITVKAHALAELLDEVGASPASLDAATGRFREMPGTRRLVDELWAALSRPGVGSTLLADGLFMRLVGGLLEEAGAGSAAPATGPRAGEARFVRALEYAEANLGEALTLGELAGVAEMSRSGFARAFRTAYGVSIWGYVQERRTVRALDLLRATALSTDEIAGRCGFASGAHLASVVTARTGRPPGAVRRR